MVAALGGPADVIERSVIAPSPFAAPVYADRAGYLSEVDVRAVGMAVIALGGGRARIDDQIDVRVGFSGIAPLGARVGPQEPMAFVHAATKDSAEAAMKALQLACTIADTPPKPGKVIHARLT